ncbi:tuberous sclerosis 1 [Botrytis cinerea]
MPSIADSPILRPERRLDSPTLPPVIATSPSHTHLQDMLDSQRAGSIRGGIYQTLTNDSVQSLALSHHAQDNTSHVDSYLQSLTRAHALRSPSLRPGTNDSTKVAYLQRDIMLLKNDLNFERYLKQQHLTHIGQLRRKAIREARVEAETQNLINSNKILRAKLEDTKKAILVVQAEYKVSHATQEIQVVESNKEELERLRIEAEKLTTKLRRYEAREVEMDQAKQDEEQAYNTIEILNMKLKAKDAEIQQLIAKFQKELQEAQNASPTGFKQLDPAKQKVIDEALAGHDDAWMI